MNRMVSSEAGCTGTSERLWSLSTVFLLFTTLLLKFMFYIGFTKSVKSPTHWFPFASISRMILPIESLIKSSPVHFISMATCIICGLQITTEEESMQRKCCCTIQLSIWLSTWLLVSTDKLKHSEHRIFILNFQWHLASGTVNKINMLRTWIASNTTCWMVSLCRLNRWADQFWTRTDLPPN